VKQYLNAGAEVDFPNHLGLTPLHKTIIHFENKHASRIVSHLLQAGSRGSIRRASDLILSFQPFETVSRLGHRRYVYDNPLIVGKAQGGSVGWI